MNTRACVPSCDHLSLLSYGRLYDVRLSGGENSAVGQVRSFQASPVRRGGDAHGHDDVGGHPVCRLGSIHSYLRATYIQLL